MELSNWARTVPAHTVGDPSNALPFFLCMCHTNTLSVPHMHNLSPLYIRTHATRACFTNDTLCCNQCVHTHRGTLGGAQLVLGMDRNLPYNARQV